METNTNKKLGIKKLVIALVVTLSAISNIGCDRNRGQGAQFNGGWNGGGWPIQPGWPGAPGFGFGFGPQGYGVDQFTGSEVYMEYGMPQNFNQDPFFYTGQVSVAGFLTTQGLQCLNLGGFGQPQIGVAPGQYQMFSFQPAMAQNGIVQNASLMAQGPAQLVIQVSWAHIQAPIGFNGNLQNALPLTATMTVQSVNGFPCNAVMTVQPVW